MRERPGRRDRRPGTVPGLRRRRAAGTMAAVLVMTALAAGCRASGSGELRGRTFLSQSVTQDGRPLPLVVGTTIHMTFHDDGRVSAAAGCNSMGGLVRMERGRLVVTGLSTTEMGCDPARHAQDEWLAGFLSAEPSWTYEEPRLELRTAGTTVVLLDRAVADPDRPVEGTTWRLDGTVEGDAVASMPSGVEGSLTFRDGRVDFDIAGCAAGWAGAVVGPSTIEVGPVSMSRSACAGVGAQVVRAVTEVLAGPVAYDVEASSLSLTKDGRGLLLRAE